jgi:hypothetical protein
LPIAVSTPPFWALFAPSLVFPDLFRASFCAAAAPPCTFWPAEWLGIDTESMQHDVHVLLETGVLDRDAEAQSSSTMTPRTSIS